MGRSVATVCDVPKGPQDVIFYIKTANEHIGRHEETDSISAQFYFNYIFYGGECMFFLYLNWTIKLVFNSNIYLFIAAVMS